MAPDAAPERVALDAAEIFRRLAARGVDFVVIGGIAAVLHGSSRNTFDLDLVFATDEANLEALGHVLSELGARLRGVADDVPFVPDATTLRRVEILMLSTIAGDLDLLRRPAGAPSYDRLRARADRFDIGDVVVSVAAINDLVAMKSASNRPKHQADLAELTQIRSLRRS
jgi:predicted nucleotidyltransferase